MHTSPHPHDLLKIGTPQCIEQLDKAPAWVEKSLTAAPFLVVRRAPPLEGAIAIGVRGNSRDERWPGYVYLERIEAIFSPFELCSGNSICPGRLEAISALRNLTALEKKWCNVDFKWGPGGSVGFELASGYPAATPQSDLDIVIFAPESFDHLYARELLSSVDVTVEAPECAFKLKDYVAGNGAPVLLRCVAGPRLGAAPWRVELAADSSELDGLSEKLEVPA
jgi:phosphoribosyl-dephospho-CoA transferase